MIRSIYFRLNFIIKKFYIKEVIDKNCLSEIRKIWDNLNKTYFEEFDYNLLVIENIDKSLNQYIRQFLLRLNFINGYLFFCKSKNIKFVYPLPNKMLKIIDQSGFRVNFFLSRLLWILLIISNIFYSLFLFIYFLIRIFLTNFEKKKTENKFDFCFPNLNPIGQITNINKWINNQYQIQNFNLYFSEKSAILANIKKFSYIKFTAWFLKSFSFSITKLLTLRWYNIFLLPESIKAAVVKYSEYEYPKKNIYLWINNIYRPIWTIVKSDNRYDTTLIYGGSFDEILLNGKSNFEPDWIGTEICTWDKHLVLDNQHQKFIHQKYSIKIKSEIIKKPLLLSTEKIKVDLPEKYIAVFAYENNKINLGIGSYTDYEYSSGRKYIHGKLIFDFYNDLLDICKKNQIILLTKRKRKSKISLKLVDTFFKNLNKDKNFLEVDHRSDVMKIIENSKGCISLPITSTAMLAREANIPSAFYDPYNWINKNDPSLSNIDVFDYEKLNNFIKKINI